MAACGDSGKERFAELYERARAARQQTREALRQVRSTRQQIKATHDKVAASCQRVHDASRRTDEVIRLWLRPADRYPLRYSAYARLQARLASMPVIEQAKGIIMAQCGWSAAQAFSALRQASQRSNIRVRDLAARIVAMTTDTAPAPPRATTKKTPGNAAAGDSAAIVALSAHRPDQGTAQPAAGPPARASAR